MTRYRVTIFEIEGTQINDTFIRATDTISALVDTVRLGPVGPGEYVAIVACFKPVFESRRRIVVNVDGSITIGARWNLPTPAERIPDDGTLPVGCPDV
jgi:hypothetical protein